MLRCSRSPMPRAASCSGSARQLSAAHRPPARRSDIVSPLLFVGAALRRGCRCGAAIRRRPRRRPAGRSPVSVGDPAGEPLRILRARHRHDRTAGCRVPARRGLLGGTRPSAPRCSTRSPCGATASARHPSSMPSGCPCSACSRRVSGWPSARCSDRSQRPHNPEMYKRTCTDVQGVRMGDGSRRRRDPEARRREIVTAAAELIVEVGAEAVTHRKVAARAGVPLGATTQYFDTLDDLRSAAFRALADEVDARLDGVRTDHRRPRGQPRRDRRARVREPRRPPCRAGRPRRGHRGRA